MAVRYNNGGESDTMHPNTEKLHKLMDRHKVDAQDVADMLGREVNTVRVWRVESTVRPIPDDTLALLEMKLQERARKIRERKAKSSGKPHT